MPAITTVALLLLMIFAPSGEPSVDERPTRSEISRIESELVMPEGAEPLNAYSRFYAATTTNGRRVIIAEFVFGDPKRLLEHRTILETVSPSVFIVDKDNMPSVMDGGCGVVTLSYDAEVGKITPPTCNGLA